MLLLKNWSLRLLSILKRTAANITEDMKGSKPISLSTLKWSRSSNEAFSHKHVLAFVFLYFCRIIYSSQVLFSSNNIVKLISVSAFNVTRKFRILVIAFSRPLLFRGHHCYLNHFIIVL